MSSSNISNFPFIFVCFTLLYLYIFLLIIIITPQFGNKFELLNSRLDLYILLTGSLCRIPSFLFKLYNISDFFPYINKISEPLYKYRYSLSFGMEKVQKYNEKVINMHLQNSTMLHLFLFYLVATIHVCNVTLK